MESGEKKKLRQAALHIVGGSLSKAYEVLDMRQDGSLSAADAKERLESLTCDLMGENEKAVELFLLVQTQWRAVEGARLGLDYNVVFVVMGSMGIPKKERLGLLKDIQTMEDETLAYFARKKEARHG